MVVTASIASGGGTLEGTITATTDASGFAKFGDLGISGTGAQTLEFAIAADTVIAAPIDLSALPAEATTGKWGPVVSWDIVPLHLSLLPTGKIIGWGKFESNGKMGMPAALGSGERVAVGRARWSRWTRCSSAPGTRSWPTAGS